MGYSSRRAGSLCVDEWCLSSLGDYPRGVGIRRRSHYCFFEGSSTVSFACGVIVTGVDTWFAARRKGEGFTTAYNEMPLFL